MSAKKAFFLFISLLRESRNLFLSKIN